MIPCKEQIVSIIVYLQIKNKANMSLIAKKKHANMCFLCKELHVKNYSLQKNIFFAKCPFAKKIFFAKEYFLCEKELQTHCKEIENLHFSRGKMTKNRARSARKMFLGCFSRKNWGNAKI